MNIRFIIVISLLALGACAGGGTTDPFANAVTLQPGQTAPEDRAFITQTQAVAARFTNAGSLGAFSPQAGTVVFGAPSEDGVLDIRFDTAGHVVEFKGGATNIYSYLNGTVAIAEDADGTILILDQLTDPVYAGFAGWSQSSAPGRLPAPGTSIAFGVIGAPITTLPTGTATYRGRSVGMDNDLGVAWITASDIAVNTDFTNVTVASTNTIVEELAGTTVYSESGLDFAASGVVGSGAYTATGDGMTVNGAFFGPNAEETGGTFHGTSSYGSDYGGAFVAGR